MHTQTVQAPTLSIRAPAAVLPEDSNDPPLCAVARNLLAVGTSAHLSTYRLPNTPHATPLSSIRAPRAREHALAFRDIALAPSGTALAVLVSVPRSRAEHPDHARTAGRSCSSSNAPPSVLVLDPVSMRLLTRFEPRYLPSENGTTARPPAHNILFLRDDTLLVDFVLYRFALGYDHVYERIPIGECPGGILGASTPKCPCVAAMHSRYARSAVAELVARLPAALCSEWMDSDCTSEPACSWRNQTAGSATDIPVYLCIRTVHTVSVWMLCHISTDGCTEQNKEPALENAPFTFQRIVEYENPSLILHAVVGLLSRSRDTTTSHVGLLVLSQPGPKCCDEGCQSKGRHSTSRCDPGHSNAGLCGTDSQTAPRHALRSCTYSEMCTSVNGLAVDLMDSPPCGLIWNYIDCRGVRCTYPCLKPIANVSTKDYPLVANATDSQRIVLAFRGSGKLLVLDPMAEPHVTARYVPGQCGDSNSSPALKERADGIDGQVVRWEHAVSPVGTGETPRIALVFKQNQPHIETSNSARSCLLTIESFACSQDA